MLPFKVLWKLPFFFFSFSPRIPKIPARSVFITYPSIYWILHISRGPRYFRHCVVNIGYELSLPQRIFYLAFHCHSLNQMFHKKNRLGKTAKKYCFIDLTITFQILVLIIYTFYLMSRWLYETTMRLGITKYLATKVILKITRNERSFLYLVIKLNQWV